MELTVNGVRHEAFSAGPDAPVIPHVERASVVWRARAALARGLERTAKTIAPAQPAPECPCLG